MAFYTFFLNLPVWVQLRLDEPLPVWVDANLTCADFNYVRAAKYAGAGDWYNYKTFGKRCDFPNGFRMANVRIG